MHIRQLILASLLAIAPALAQTTGVPGMNDYTINSLGSGSTSCTPLCFPNGGVTLGLNVSAPTGSVIIFVFNFCPCLACSLPAPANACTPTIPSTACGGSNQSADINLSSACGIALTLVGVTNTAGTVSAILNIPPLVGPPCSIVQLSTQAVVINPCGLGVPPSLSGPFVLTQGYTLNF
jgi:hypothetical protein